MAFATIRPGLVVLFSTNVHDDGLSRDTRDVTQAEDAALTTEGTVRRTQTLTIHRDPAEHKRARDLASKVTMLVRRHCTANEYLWHCSFDDFDALTASLDEARRLIDEHNASPETRYTRVSSYLFTAIVGLDVSDEQRAKAREIAERSAREMAEEVNRIFDAMNRGIDDLDPEAIRAAVARAQAYGPILAADQATAVESAVENARKAARTITKLTKKGEKSESILASVTRSQIAQARVAFLDLDPIELAPVSNALPPVNVQRVASLDLDDADPVVGPFDFEGPPSPFEASIEGMV